MTITLGDGRLDERFAALSNSTRRSILAGLAEGEATVNELAEPFELTLPAISKHIKVLERAGLISRSRRAQSRPTSTDRSGTPVSIGWRPTCRASTTTTNDPNNRARKPMADDNNGDSEVIERILETGVDRVWLMWTDPLHFAEW